jgi:outer membrane protein TolC
MAPLKAIVFGVLLTESFLGAQSVSLQEIFNFATHNAKVLQLKAIDAKIEAANVKSAESGYYPTLGVVYNAEYNQALDGNTYSSEYIGGLTISSQTRYQSSIAFQLNYNLYDFGATEKQVAAAKEELDAKKIEWCSEEKKLYKEILQQYADGRKAMLEQKYKNKMLLVHKKLYTVKERLYKAGEYSRIDLGDEAIAVMKLESDIENARMRYQEDIFKISQLSYMPLDIKTRLLPLKTNNDLHVKIQFEETPKAKELQKHIAKKRNEISMQTRKNLPSLALYGNYYLYSSHPTAYDYTVSHLNKKSWNAGLALRYTFFDGFKSSAQKERLHLQLLHLQEEFADAKHAYEVSQAAKYNKIDEIKFLEEKDQNLIDNNQKKIAMLDRLRKERQVDLLTRLNAQYELLGRILNMQVRKVDAAYERISLDILQRGMKECTRH